MSKIITAQHRASTQLYNLVAVNRIKVFMVKDFIILVLDKIMMKIILTAGNNTKKGCPVSVHIKMHLTKHYPSKMDW